MAFSSNRKHPNAQNFTFIELDIEDQEKLGSSFQKEEQFDAVLNLAARAGVRYSMENPHVYLSTNAVGTLNLLEMHAGTRIQKNRSGFHFVTICWAEDSLYRRPCGK